MPTPASPATADTTTGPAAPAGSSSPASPASSVVPAGEPRHRRRQLGQRGRSRRSGTGVAEPGQDREDFAEHARQLLTLQVGHVIVQLGSQRKQRAAARPADHDLAQQVRRQLLRQHRAGHPQHLRRGLPCPGQAGIIQDRQLPGDPRLHRLQYRLTAGQRHARHRRLEDLADHQRQMLGLLLVARAQFPGGELDSGRGRRSQRPLLISAED